MGSETRQRLIEAARDLMHETSFAAVSVGDVCAAAGANRGSLYHFFASKEELGQAVLEENWARMSRVIEAALEEELPPLERIDLFVAHFAEMLSLMRDHFGATPGCPVGTLGAELAGHAPDLRAAVRATLDAWIGRFHEMVVAAQADGTVPRDVDARGAARRLVAHIQGLATLAQAYDDPALVETGWPGSQALIAAG